MIFKSDSQRRACFANIFSRKGSIWLVFGDSIAMGYNDKKGGWVEKLKHVVYPEPVYNLGVDGDSIDDVADRILDESDRRLGSGDTAKIIIAVGINDAVKSSSDGTGFSRLLDAAESVSDGRNITVLLIIL
jgi:lysophospholipase L1-like esterase